VPRCRAQPSATMVGAAMSGAASRLAGAISYQRISALFADESNRPFRR
jgi:hypothetical protein